jgi:hypothetical protein
VLTIFFSPRIPDCPAQNTRNFISQKQIATFKFEENIRQQRWLENEKSLSILFTVHILGLTNYAKWETGSPIPFDTSVMRRTIFWVHCQVGSVGSRYLRN